MSGIFKKYLSGFLILAMVVTFIPLFATQQAHAAAQQSVEGYVLAKDGETYNKIASWTFDEQNETYIDSNGNEMAGVTEANFDNFGTGETQNYILYTGNTRAPGASGTKAGIILKYVNIEDLSSAIAKEAGIEYDKKITDVAVTAYDGKGDIYSSKDHDPNNYIVNNEMSFYSSPSWLLERLQGGSPSLEGRTDLVSVPVNLAIVGRHFSGNEVITANNGNAPATIDELKTALQKLANGEISGLECDTDKALRFELGMDATDPTATTYTNMGFLSLTGLYQFRLAPAYYSISVNNGEAKGTEGEDGYQITTDDYAVTASDNYFKGAKGEKITLTITPNEDYLVKDLKVATSEEDVEVTQESGNVYSFEMPAENVTVSVDGVEYDPETSTYTINSASELANFAASVNGGNIFSDKEVTLTDDIDLSSYEDWTPIGNASNAFDGVFDGQNHTISNLTFTSSSGYKGLFGNNSGTVENIKLNGSYGTSDKYMTAKGDYLAGAVAYNTGLVQGIVADVDMYLTGGGYSTGGIVGLNNGGTVTQCGNNGAIKCDDSVSFYRTGGVVGYMKSGIISESYNKAHVEAWNYRNGNQGTGGILGSMDGGTVSSCYNTGNIYNGLGDNASGGKQGTGGIVGAISAGDVDSCYATGEVHAPGSAGVIIGKVGNGTYSNLYSLYSARAYQQYGTKTDSTNEWLWPSQEKFITNVKYSDGSDENADGSFLFKAAAIANSYNSGFTITGSYTKTDKEMKSEAFAKALGDKFQAQCGYPILSWETPKEHTSIADGTVVYDGFDAIPETVALNDDTVYPVTGYVYCGDCGCVALVSEQSETTYEDTKTPTGRSTGTRIYTAAFTEEGLETQTIEVVIDKTMTDEEISAADKALEQAAEDIIEANGDLATGKYTAESFNAVREKIKVLNALYDDENATEAKIKAAQAELIAAWRNLEPVNQEVGAAADAANALVNELTEVYYSILPNADSYTADTMNSLKEALANAETVLAADDSTTSELSAARLTVLKSVNALKEKNKQTITVTTKTKSVKVKKVKKAARVVTGAVTVSDAQGTVQYVKKSGSSKLNIDSATGNVTVKKGTKKGAYKIKVKVSASGNDNYMSASKTVTVKVKVKK